MKKQISLLFICLLFSGCQKYYISIAQESVTRDSLASTQLGTPDPRQKNPPTGERLIIEWKVPREYLSKEVSLCLHVIYKDYTEAYFTYPVPYRMDYVVYNLLGEDYLQKKGILTYEAELTSKEGSSLLTWKHQLWTKLIMLEDEEESSSWTDNNRSSVFDHPRQGSVREVEGQIEEEND